MAVVISITVYESEQQVISGIPQFVKINTNIPATIFYTLDGSQPTTSSTIYTGPVFLPYNQVISVCLKIYATNGTDSSPVVSEIYGSNEVEKCANIRLPHSATNACPGPLTPYDQFPFGTPPYQPNQRYLSNAEAGITVYDPNLPAVPNAFDADGNPTGFTNEPYNTDNYQIIYSTTDAEGNQGRNIGTRPANVMVEPYRSDILPDTSQQGGQDGEYSYQFTQLFDPRALVVFQDFINASPEDQQQLNRQSFTLTSNERTYDGALLSSDAIISGSFIRSSYNPNTQTMTNYFRDSISDKWIISESAYTPKSKEPLNLGQIKPGRNPHVFEWLATGYYRRLI